MAKRRHAPKKQTAATGAINSQKRQATYTEGAPAAPATVAEGSERGGSKMMMMMTMEKKTTQAASPQMTLEPKQSDGDTADIIRTARARTAAPKPVLPLTFQPLHVTAVESEVTGEVGGVFEQEMSETATSEQTTKDNTLDESEEATPTAETTSGNHEHQNTVQNPHCNDGQRQVSETATEHNVPFEDAVNAAAVGALSTGAVEGTAAPEESESMAERQSESEQLFAQSIDVVHGEPIAEGPVSCTEMSSEHAASEDTAREELAHADEVSEDSKSLQDAAEETATEGAVPEERVLWETSHKAPVAEEALPVEDPEDVELLPNELIDWRQWSAIDLADLDTEDLIDIGTFYKTAQKNEPHRQLPEWPVIVLGPKTAVDTMFKKRFEHVARTRPQLAPTQQALLAVRLLYKDLNPLPTPGTPYFVRQLQEKLIAHHSGRLNMSSSLYIVHVDHPHLCLRRTLFALNFPGIYKPLPSPAPQNNDNNNNNNDAEPSTPLRTCPWQVLLTEDITGETMPSPYQAAFEAISQMTKNSLASLDTIRDAAKPRLQRWIQRGNADELFADLDPFFLDVQFRADYLLPLIAEVNMLRRRPGIAEGVPAQRIILSAGGLDGHASDDGESCQPSDADIDLPQAMPEDDAALMHSQETVDVDCCEDGDHDVKPDSLGASVREGRSALKQQSLAENEPVEGTIMAQDEILKQPELLHQEEPRRESEPLEPDSIVDQEGPILQDTPVQQDEPVQLDKPVQPDGLVSQEEPVKQDESTKKDPTIEGLDSQSPSGKAGHTAPADLPTNGEDVQQQPTQGGEADKTSDQQQSPDAVKSDSSATLVDGIQTPAQPSGPTGDEPTGHSQAREVEAITHHGSAVAIDNSPKTQTAQPTQVARMPPEKTKPLPRTDPSSYSTSQEEREMRSGKTTRKGSKKKGKNVSSKSDLKAFDVAKGEVQTTAPSGTGQKASINGGSKPDSVKDRDTQTNEVQKVVQPQPSQKTLRRKSVAPKTRQTLKPDAPKHQSTTPTQNGYKASEKRTSAPISEEVKKAPTQEIQTKGRGKPKADVKEPAWLAIFTPESKTVVTENHISGPSQADQDLQEGRASPLGVDLSSSSSEAEKRVDSSLEQVKKSAAGNRFTSKPQSSEKKHTPALPVSALTQPTESAQNECDALLSPDLSLAVDAQESQTLKAFDNDSKGPAARTSPPIAKGEFKVKTQKPPVSSSLSQSAQAIPPSDTTSTKDKHDGQQSDMEDHKRMMAQQIMEMLQPKREGKEVTSLNTELKPEQLHAQREERAPFSESRDFYKRSHDNGRVRKGSAPSGSPSVQTTSSFHGLRRNSAPHRVTEPGQIQRPTSRQQNHNQNGEQRQGGRGKKGRRKAHSHRVKDTELPARQVEAEDKSEALPNTLTSTTRRQAKTLKHFLVNVIGGNGGANSDDGTQVIATTTTSAEGSTQPSCQSRDTKESADVGLTAKNPAGPDLIEMLPGAESATTPLRDARHISASSEKTKAKAGVEKVIVDSKDVQLDVPARPVDEGISLCDASAGSTSVSTEVVSAQTKAKLETEAANDLAITDIQSTSLEPAKEGAAPVLLAVAAVPEATRIAEVANVIESATQIKEAPAQVCKPKRYPPPLVVDGSQKLIVPMKKIPVINHDPRHRHLESHHSSQDARLSRNDPRRQPRRSSREASWNRQPRRPRAESFAHGSRPDEQPFPQDYRQVQTLRPARSWHGPSGSSAQFPGMFETPGRHSAHNSPPNLSVARESPCKNCGFSEQHQISEPVYGAPPFETSHSIQHQAFHALPYNLPPSAPPMSFYHPQTPSPPYKVQRLCGPPNNQPPQFQAPPCVLAPFTQPLQNNGFHNQGPQFVQQQIPGHWSQSHSLPSHSSHGQSPQSQSSQRYPSQHQSPRRHSPVAYPSIGHSEPTYNELGYIPRRHSPVDRVRASSVAPQLAGRRSA